MKDPKKHTDAIRDKIDAYSPTEIPDFLAWDQMDEELLAGLAKAKKTGKKKNQRMVATHTRLLLTLFYLFHPLFQRIPIQSYFSFILLIPSINTLRLLLPNPRMTIFNPRQRSIPR